MTHAMAKAQKKKIAAGTAYLRSLRGGVSDIASVYPEAICWLARRYSKNPSSDWPRTNQRKTNEMTEPATSSSTLLKSRLQVRSMIQIPSRDNIAIKKLNLIRANAQM